MTSILKKGSVAGASPASSTSMFRFPLLAFVFSYSFPLCMTHCLDFSDCFIADVMPAFGGY